MTPGHRALARPGAPAVQQPVRGERDQPGLERGRHAARAHGRLSQRPGRADHGPGDARGGRAAIRRRQLRASPSARGGSRPTSLTPGASSRGPCAGGTGNPWGDIPGRDIFLDGYLPDDHRHAIKASLGYQATPWLSFGSRTFYTSGFPYDRLFRNPETTNYDVYRALRGVNPGTNINDPSDDRELRLPDQLEMNLQARVNLLPAHRPAARLLRRRAQPAGAAHGDRRGHQRRPGLRRPADLDGPLPDPPRPELPVLTARGQSDGAVRPVVRTGRVACGHQQRYVRSVRRVAAHLPARRRSAGLGHAISRRRGRAVG